MLAATAAAWQDALLDPWRKPPEELAAIMAADTARWAPIVKAAGFPADWGKPG